MRKAVAQTVGRRKSRKENAKAEKSSPPRGPPKMTADEAALTAKNYRLAKELSELRVRHREECKTVTKLTMENMNLASRCREALGQVGALRKELRKQQRKVQVLSKKPPQNNVELQQAPVGHLEEEKKEESSAVVKHAPKSADKEASMSSPPKLVSSDDYEEDNSESSSSFSNPADDKPKKLSPLRPPGNTTQIRPLSRPPSETSPSIREAKTSSPVYAGDVSPLNVTPTKESLPKQSPLKELPSKTALFSSPPKESRMFPHSASPTIPRSNYNEEYPGDIATRSVRHSHSPRLTNFQEEEVSSIDAFEASFQTSFPPSFSPEEKKANADAYNPFHASPQRPMEDPKQTVKPVGGLMGSISEQSPTSIKAAGQKETPFEKKHALVSASATIPVTASANVVGKENSSSKLVNNKERNAVKSIFRNEKEVATNKINTPTLAESSPIASPPKGIRERAAASYRRPTGARWTGPTSSPGSDPPGRDRTSTRKSGPLAGMQRKFSPVTTRAPPKKTTYGTPEPSPREQVQGSNYGTPSPPSLSPIPAAKSAEPPKPEKTGYGEARARYEQALQPPDQRSNNGEIPFDFVPVKATPVSPEQGGKYSSPPRTPSNSLRARIAAYSESVESTSQDGWSDSALPSDEDDGQIPMNSKLTPGRLVTAD